MLARRSRAGSRVYLQRTLPEQIDDSFLRMYSNPDGKNAHFRLSGKEYTREELVDFCSRGLAEGNVFYYSVCAQSDDAVIGSVRIGPINFKNSLSDIVALIGDVRDRGSGLGTEAITEGIRIAFEVHNVRKLSGGILEPNVASLKAYKRAGCFEEGRLVGHYLVEGRPVDWIIVSCFNPKWDAVRALAPESATE